MIIRIMDIPADGLEFSDTLSLESINSRMEEGKGNDIQFISAPEATIRITPSPGGAEVKGLIQSRYQQPCSICLDELPRQEEISVHYILKKRPDGGEPAFGNDPDELRDDIGLVYFDGEQFDLESLLQEAIILQLDRFWRPEKTIQGDCSHCGKSLDELQQREGKTNLGDLMKKAGIH